APLALDLLGVIAPTRRKALAPVGPGERQVQVGDRPDGHTTSAPASGGDSGSDSSSTAVGAPAPSVSGAARRGGSASGEPRTRLSLTTDLVSLRLAKLCTTSAKLWSQPGQEWRFTITTPGSASPTLRGGGGAVLSAATWRESSDCKAA